jgi:hypothetical protein
MYLKAPNVKSHGFYFPTSREWVIFLNKFRFKNWATSLRHNIFKAAHVSDLKNVLSTAFSTCFILVPVWGKAPFPQTGTRMKRVGIYASSTWKFIITMAPPTKTIVAPGKPSPSHQVGPVSLGSLHCVHCKKTHRFCSQICQEKSIFECTIGAWHFVDCVIFPSNEYNEGHPYLQQ